MIFDYTIKISDLLHLLTLITAVFGGLFALYKWNKSMRVKRADYIKGLIEIKNNEWILETFTLFDYDSEWYNMKFHGSELENKIDYTLTYFDFICYLNDRGIFDKETFMLFKYQIDSIVKNKQIHNYFYNLYHYSLNNGLATSYYYLLKYALKNKCIDDSFMDKASHMANKLYNQYLNW